MWRDVREVMERLENELSYFYMNYTSYHIFSYKHFTDSLNFIIKFFFKCVVLLVIIMSYGAVKPLNYRHR